MIGRSAQAIGAADKMTTIVPKEMLREPGMAFLQHHMTRHLQMKVRSRGGTTSSPRRRLPMICRTRTPCGSTLAAGRWRRAERSRKPKRLLILIDGTCGNRRGHVAEEAERAFREDLKGFPENGWSLLSTVNAEERVRRFDAHACAIMDVMSRACRDRP